MGAYGLNKLDEFEKSSRVKFDEAFKMKLDRNRVRACRPLLRPTPAMHAATRCATA